jgi:hypothetical protein
LDYKTNEVAAGQSAAAAQRYEMQIYVYALAAEQALGAPLAELALCFLRPGVEYDFPWNDGARRRCVELVQDAMVGLIADGSALNDF